LVNGYLHSRLSFLLHVTVGTHGHPL
jgi:hypothetical protein